MREKSKKTKKQKPTNQCKRFSTSDRVYALWYTIYHNDFYNEINSKFYEIYILRWVAALLLSYNSVHNLDILKAVLFIFVYDIKTIHLKISSINITF